MRAFVTYVRPLLEYAPYVWSPHSVSQVKKTESVQRRFWKRFLCCCGLQHSERLVKLESDSLELRRIRSDLIYVYKLLFGMVDLNFDDFFALSSCSIQLAVITTNCFYAIRVWIFVNIFSESCHSLE